MRKLIEVTEEDIRLGERDNPTSCPVARAISRQIDAERVLVFGFEAKIGGLFIPLSRSVSKFIGKFDHGKPVNPFRFYLRYS